jgi:hypothetical protein
MLRTHSREPMARWKLALLVLFSLSFLGFALSRNPPLGLLLLVLGWAALGLSALRWGYDSRDGRDWDDPPGRRQRPRSPEIRFSGTDQERPEGLSRGPGPG